MKKYYHILKHYKVELILCPLLVLTFVVCETILPTMMARIIDDGIMLHDLSVVTETGIQMILISLVGLVANIANVYLSSKTSVGFGTDLRSELFGKIQQLSFPEIDQFNSASLITRLTGDISRIQQLVAMAMRIMLRSPLMMIMAFFFVLRINAQLALIVLAAIPVLAVSIYFIFKKGFPVFVIVQRKVDKLNAVIRENLINIRVVKSFVREDFETEKFKVSSTDLQDTAIKAANTIVSVFPVMQLVMNVSVAAILWFGGQKVIAEGLKVGELVSLVNYMVQILMSLMMLSMIIVMFIRAAASSQRIIEVFDTEPSLQETPEAIREHPGIENGTVEFRDVAFRYPGGNYDVLKAINFSTRKGETIALVGGTGSGKSSLLQLIPRLYDTGVGEVLIDGINVKNYTQDELHAKVGMVLQNNELFTGTIEENLRWGNKDAGFGQIIEAAKAAQAHDFILSFPDGYHSMLERGGVNISGGQKQRLCIARALLRQPKILLLDDSTSAVDTNTEQKIRTGLKQLLAGTSVFIVTQRIGVMQQADKIIVLDDGKIASMGTHEELLSRSKIYNEIYNSQQL